MRLFTCFVTSLVCAVAVLAALGTPTRADAGVKSVEVKCANLDAMVAFYSEAFGTSFKEFAIDGTAFHFGRVDGVLLKFGAGRKKADHDGASHVQLGFTVADVAAVIKIAEKHGGKQEGKLGEISGRVHGVVRDPDGNTIDLYQDPAGAKADPKPAPGPVWLITYARGPKWIEGKGLQEQPGLAEHGSYMKDLWDAGVLRDGGPLIDDQGGMITIRAKNAEAAKKIVAEDPGIRNGVFKLGTIHPWYPVDWKRYPR